MPKTECYVFFDKAHTYIQQKFLGENLNFELGENELILKSTNLDGKLGCIQQWNTNCYGGGRMNRMGRRTNTNKCS